MNLDFFGGEGGVGDILLANENANGMTPLPKAPSVRPLTDPLAVFITLMTFSL